MSRFEHITFDRITRHVIFWLVWIFGFTFVKSIGEPMHEYLGWFIYYLLTLPVFVAHTYLVVYWLISSFLRGWRILLFVSIFAILLYLFSLLELLISHGLIARWFPDIFGSDFNYLSPGNVFVSGLGNLYIVLVFISVKMIRTWYLAREEKRMIHQSALMVSAAGNNLFIQPGFLMHAMEMIEHKAAEGDPNVSGSIAMVSELLNGLNSMKESDVMRMDEELRLIRLLIDFYSNSEETRPPRLMITGSRSKIEDAPPLLAFTVTEILFRESALQNTEELHLELNAPGSVLSIRAISQPAPGTNVPETSANRLETLLNAALENYFPGRYRGTADLKDGNGLLVSVYEYEARATGT